MGNDRRKSNNRIFYLLLIVILIVILYIFLDDFNIITGEIQKFINVLKPFIFGIIIAFLFYIPCKGVEKLLKKVKFSEKIARVLSIFIVYILAILLILLLVNIVLPTLSKSIGELGANLPSYYNSAVEYVNDMPENEFITKTDVKNVINNLQQFDITEIFSLENILNYIKSAVGVANAVFNIFVTIIMSIYILIERNRIIGFIEKLNKAIFKNDIGEKINKYFIEANNVFLKFISNQILDGIIVGIIVSIALIIMRVKYAVLLGFLIGLFNIIPFFGAIIAVAIATLITIFTGGFSKAIWMLIVVIILQQIDANIINPKIVGNALKISPIIIIVSVTIGGAYFGVMGMFLAVPIAAVIKEFLDDFIENKSKQSEEQITEPEKETVKTLKQKKVKGV